jgi:hypothetical protein
MKHKQLSYNEPDLKDLLFGVRAYTAVPKDVNKSTKGITKATMV